MSSNAVLKAKMHALEDILQQRQTSLQQLAAQNAVLAERAERLRQQADRAAAAVHTLLACYRPTSFDAVLSSSTSSSRIHHAAPPLTPARESHDREKTSQGNEQQQQVADEAPVIAPTLASAQGEAALAPLLLASLH